MTVEPQKPQGHPSPPFIATAPALESLALLDRGLGSREPFVLFTGEPGVGKSVLLREALRRWGGRVCARELAPAEANAETLFATLLARFGGAQANGSAVAERMADAIAHAASGGKVAMVVVDDAQSAAPELLLQLANVAETMRRRQCAFEILLAGTPELSARLNDPRLASLSGKLASQVRLLPLTQHDTRHYLLQRSGHDAASSGSGLFSRKACRDIHGATFGIPRAIDTLADEAARRAARAGVTTISPEHVRSATQALRARRGSAPVTAIAPRSERMGTTAPKPVSAKPASAAPPQPSASTKPAPAPAQPSASAKPTPAPAQPAASAKPTPAATPQPASVKPAPAPANGADAPAARVAASAKPAPAVTTATSATVAAPPSDTKSPESDQRVKDWVSRFGGSGAVRIGMGHGIPRFDAPTAADAATAQPTQDAGEPAPSPNRILIVDKEPPLPPELVARLNKVTKQKRRRGPSATVQGTALAVAVGLIVVLLARQAGFGKGSSTEVAGTGSRAVATPAPPLNLDPRSGPASSSAPRPGSQSLRGSVQPAEPTRAKPSEAVSRATSRPAAKKPVATTPARTESLPPPLAASVPVPSTPAPVAPDPVDEGTTGQRFGIIAGSFPTSDMAKAEKDHLARLTTYRVWVTKAKVDGQRTFHLMVGRFDTMERAWEAGQTLMRRGLIRDANVRPLTEREAR